VTTTAAVLLIPLLINTLLNFGTLLPQLIYWLTQLFQVLGIRKRRKSWGVVFNSQTGQPVPLAMVRIIDKRYNRVLEQAVTDNQGRYGFLVRVGTFYMTAAKSGFVFPSKEKSSTFYEKIYVGGDFKVAGKDQTVAYNIPLDPHMKPSAIISLWVFFIKFNRLLERLRVPLLIIGIIFSVIMMFVAFELIYLLSLIFYILLGILEYLRTRKARPYGVVTDTFNHPLEMTIVRIYKKENNRLIETDVTDRDGRFRFLVAPGVYYVVASKPGYIDFKSHLMYLQKEKTLVSTTIKLKKEEK
jgi:5-hydroxyisourate hydrolase-like protein (transthyretin family)